MCSGWGRSAEMRMACCAALDDHESQASVDACCALGEQRQNAESARSLLTSAVPVRHLTEATIASLFNAAVVPGPRFEIREHDAVTTTSDTQALLSVFVI